MCEMICSGDGSVCVCCVACNFFILLPFQTSLYVALACSYLHPFQVQLRTSSVALPLSNKP